MNITSGASVVGVISRDLGVDVREPGRKGGSRRQPTYGIFIRKPKAKTIGLVEVKRIGVKDPDVHEPFLEIRGRNESYAVRERALYLIGRRGQLWLGFTVEKTKAGTFVSSCYSVSNDTIVLERIGRTYLAQTLCREHRSRSLELVEPLGGKRRRVIEAPSDWMR